MNKLAGYLIVSIAVAFSGFWAVTQVDLTSFSPGDLIEAEQVNANFQRLAEALDGKQQRVTESCEEGAFVRAVNEDGSVTCAGGEGGGSEPTVEAAASVRNSLQQAIPSNEQTLVTFDEVEFEQGGDLFFEADPSRLVAPEDGLYAIDVQVFWRQEATSGFISSSLHVNAAGSCSRSGTDAEAHATEQVEVGRAAVQHLSLLKRLEAGDHVELCVVQGTGEDKFVEGFGQSWATLRRVGAAE